MIYDIAPKPTRYDGVLYRSRTEARWAMFFTLAKIRFDYEPETFDFGSGDYYLPDFWLPDANAGKGLFIEIKPTRVSFESREYCRCEELYNVTGKDVSLFWGAPVMHRYATKDANCTTFSARFGDTFSSPSAEGYLCMLARGKEKTPFLGLWFGEGVALPIKDAGDGDSVFFAAERAARDYRFGA